jgi:hypothetical protein
MREHRSDWSCERCGKTWSLVVRYEGSARDPARTLKNVASVACLTRGCPTVRAVLVDADWEVAEVKLLQKA